MRHGKKRAAMEFTERNEDSAMNPRFFEETYVKYPFAPLVTLVLDAADVLADFGNRLCHWLRPTPTGLGGRA